MPPKRPGDNRGLWGDQMKFVAPILAALLLAGCVTTSELPLSKNVWQVEVNAGGALFVNGADNAALKKAAELTIAQGYTDFIIANPNTESGVNYVGRTPGIATTNVNYSAIRRLPRQPIRLTFQSLLRTKTSRSPS